MTKKFETIIEEWRKQIGAYTSAADKSPTDERRGRLMQFAAIYRQCIADVQEAMRSDEPVKPLPDSLADRIVKRETHAIQVVGEFIAAPTVERLSVANAALNIIQNDLHAMLLHARPKQTEVPA